MMCKWVRSALAAGGGFKDPAMRTLDAQAVTAAAPAGRVRNDKPTVGRSDGGDAFAGVAQKSKNLRAYNQAHPSFKASGFLSFRAYIDPIL